LILRSSSAAFCFFACALLCAVPVAHAAESPVTRDISLDGSWQAGLNRQYTQKVTVPGLAQDATKPSPGPLWYKREVHLPDGDWSQATLKLNGARFAPKVYVDGEMVSSMGGGMAPTVHLLRSAQVKPGATITLEIELTSLPELDAKDASKVPSADLWRSDNSSGLWDSVTLHVAGDTRIVRMTPFTDFAADSVMIHWELLGDAKPRTVRAEILDPAGKVVAQAQDAASAASGETAIALHGAVKPWSPEHPAMYRLRLSVLEGGAVVDVQESPWGLKDFRTKDKRFYLNGHPEELRGGTVVWHRFLRNPEAGQVAFDPEWFKKNVVLRLKSYGANTLRFHLGAPPESLLDLCDQYGLMVQFEWPFFHGIPASDASMQEQWTAWLDLAMRHPSVVIVHPWNETEGDALKTAWAALNPVLAKYPPLVVGHRDTLHIHKYWWSLFENLGLYYDSADQFPTTIMVDEFGGNYLDQQGNPGLYRTTKDTYLRFLGRDQTKAMRLEFHAESNARVAEYWRRIGAAGFSPFCIFGSPEDGSTWFLGSLIDPKPMPVWDAMTAAWSPQSVSIDVWDRNYLPGQTVKLPVVFFNDTESVAMLHADVQLLNADGKVVLTQAVSQQVPAEGRVHTTVELVMPQGAGSWRMQAVLRDHVEGVTHPVISWWDVRTVAPKPALANVSVAIPADETELLAFAQQNKLKTVAMDDASARVMLLSAKSWEKLTQDAAMRETIEAAVHRGESVVMLDIGMRDLGQGYSKDSLGPLEGVPQVKNPITREYDLFDGVHIAFHQVAEPESHIQFGPEDHSLWNGLPSESAWLWDGLRGGLIVPADDMNITGLSPAAFAAQWVERGADAKAIADGSYTAYQLAGYYAFSTSANDKATISALRKKVKFLVDDAPALQDVVNPNAPVVQVDLAQGYKDAANGRAQRLLPLATAGKGLTRTPVAELTFGAGKGSVILSQLLTAGRLARGEGEPGFYGERYDPVADQFVLNMLADVVH